MKKLIASSIFVLFFATSILSAGKDPLPGVLGINLGMKEDAVRKLLQKIGKQQKEEKKEEEDEGGGEEEIWTLTKNPNYESLIVGFDKKHQVRYVSVFAGKNSGGVRYSDIGDLKAARLESNPSNYRYTWDVAAKGRTPRYLVIARGTDSQFLSSYSIKKF
jgi:hypothetical protein